MFDVALEECVGEETRNGLFKVMFRVSEDFWETYKKILIPVSPGYARWFRVGSQHNEPRFEITSSNSNYHMLDMFYLRIAYRGKNEYTTRYYRSERAAKQYMDKLVQLLNRVPEQSIFSDKERAVPVQKVSTVW
jgi:hypothetical protein